MDPELKALLRRARPYFSILHRPFPLLHSRDTSRQLITCKFSGMVLSVIRGSLNDEIAYQEDTPRPVTSFYWCYRRLTYRTTPRLTGPRWIAQGSAVTIAYNKYGGYCVPTSSRHRLSAQKILSGGVYEPDTVDLLMCSLRWGVHSPCGAYFGDFLPALAPCAKKVWSFEPNAENYRRALITLQINSITNVAVINAGLGRRSGALSLLVRENGNRAPEAAS